MSESVFFVTYIGGIVFPGWRPSPFPDFFAQYFCTISCNQ